MRAACDLAGVLGTARSAMNRCRATGMIRSGSPNTNQDGRLSRVELVRRRVITTPALSVMTGGVRS